MILYLHVYYVTMSLQIDDFPEDDDVSTLEVVMRMRYRMWHYFSRRLEGGDDF